MNERRPAPRIGPASREELGPLNALLVRIAARVAGTTAPPNLFTTMGRNRRMFRLWLLFAGTLMPRGGLPRRDTELVILRVAHLTGAEYEAVHHRRMARAAGLSAAQVDAIGGDDAAAAPFSPRQQLLLRAVDELAPTTRSASGPSRSCAASSPTATSSSSACSRATTGCSPG